MYENNIGEFVCWYYWTDHCIPVFSGSVFGLKKWDYWCWIEALIDYLQNDKYVSNTIGNSESTALYFDVI